MINLALCLQFILFYICWKVVKITNATWFDASVGVVTSSYLSYSCINKDFDVMLSYENMLPELKSQEDLVIELFSFLF
jgi:hypothetical protein